MTASFLEKPPAAPPPAEEEPREGNRRLPHILLGVAALVAVVAAAWVLLFRGSDEGAQVTVPAAPGAPVTEAAPPDPEPTRPQGLGSGGVDPFAPLVVPAEPEDSADPADTASGATSGGETPAGSSDFSAWSGSSGSGVGVTVRESWVGGTGSSTSGGGTTTGGTTSTATSAPKATRSPKPAGGQPSSVPSSSPAPVPVELTMVNVAEDNSEATLKVGATRHTVDVGGTFAEQFTLLRLENGECGALQYRTERFDLCEGGTVRL